MHHIIKLLEINQQQPIYVYFIQDNLGEPVPEKIFTH